MEALVLIGVGNGRGAEEREAKNIAFASVAVCKRVTGLALFRTKTSRVKLTL